MRRPSRSTSVVLSDGKTVKFPSYEDLVDALLDEGIITSEAELMDDDGLLSWVLHEWIRGGQMACSFARRVASKHERWGWYAYVDRTSGTVDFPESLDGALSDLSEYAEAISIILPEVRTAEEVARLVGQLCRGDRWYWEEVPWERCSVDRAFKCGLRWRPPIDGFQSWVLGFAPFDVLPFTRRIEGAPFSALILRPCPAGAESDRDFPAKNPGDLHLAMVPHGLSDRRRRDNYWKKTESNRKQFLAGECDEAGKAAVTFCFPESVRQLLGPQGS